MRKYILILLLLLLYGCKTSKPIQGLLITRETMTNQQQTDNIVLNRDRIGVLEAKQVEDRAAIDSIKQGFVFLDKNFKVDSLGNVSLADTINIGAIMIKGERLSILMPRIDSAILRPIILAP